MKQTILFFGLCTLLLFSCRKEDHLKSDLNQLIEEWQYVLPLPSENDSINLLIIESEMNWYRYNNSKSDSLCDLILSIDSTFHPALSFKAWKPLNMEVLEKAMFYAKKDTSVHKLILEADYAYWINKDTKTAIQKFKKVYDKYPNSKTSCWCLGMSYLWEGQTNNAIKYYEEALAIDSLFPKSYEMMGWAYFMKENYEMSIKNFETSMELGNNNANAYKYTGYAYEKADNPEKATYYFQVADSLNVK